MCHQLTIIILYVIIMYTKYFFSWFVYFLCIYYFWTNVMLYVFCVFFFYFVTSTEREMWFFFYSLNMSNTCQYLVDPASNHMLVSKVKPCMSKWSSLSTAILRIAHYISYNLFDGQNNCQWISVAILELIHTSPIVWAGF